MAKSKKNAPETPEQRRARERRAADQRAAEARQRHAESQRRAPATSPAPVADVVDLPAIGDVEPDDTFDAPVDDSAT